MFLSHSPIQEHPPADIFRFLGEESYAKGQSRDYLIDEHPTWCIDPLDGNNHSHTVSLPS